MEPGAQVLGWGPCGLPSSANTQETHRAVCAGEITEETSALGAESGDADPEAPERVFCTRKVETSTALGGDKRADRAD